MRIYRAKCGGAAMYIDEKSCASDNFKGAKRVRSTSHRENGGAAAAHLVRHPAN